MGGAARCVVLPGANHELEGDERAAVAHIMEFLSTLDRAGTGAPPPPPAYAAPPPPQAYPPPAQQQGYAAPPPQQQKKGLGSFLKKALS